MLTTRSEAGRRGSLAVGLAPWTSHVVDRPDGGSLTVTAVPAVHGPEDAERDADGFGPEARYESQETIALAFVAAMQKPPPRQRVALVLRDVLGFRSSEVADMLSVSEASVNSALQRARATMSRALPGPGRERAPLPRSAREREVATRFATAFAGGDVDGVVSLLTDDAVVHDAAGDAGVPGSGGHRRVPAVHSYLARAAAVPAGPTRANGQPGVRGSMCRSGPGRCSAGTG